MKQCVSALPPTTRNVPLVEPVIQTDKKWNHAKVIPKFEEEEKCIFGYL